MNSKRHQLNLIFLEKLCDVKHQKCSTCSRYVEDMDRHYCHVETNVHDDYLVHFLNVGFIKQHYQTTRQLYEICPHCGLYSSITDDDSQKTCGYCDTCDRCYPPDQVQFCKMKDSKNCDMKVCKTCVGIHGCCFYHVCSHCNESEITSYCSVCYNNICNQTNCNTSRAQSGCNTCMADGFLCPVCRKQNCEEPSQCTFKMHQTIQNVLPCEISQFIVLPYLSERFDTTIHQSPKKRQRIV